MGLSDACRRPTTTRACAGLSSCARGVWRWCCRLYCMRRVDCRACQVQACEAVPWGIGKHELDQRQHYVPGALGAEAVVAGDHAVVLMTWDKVCQSVQYVVQSGIEHRQMNRSARACCGSAASGRWRASSSSLP